MAVKAKRVKVAGRKKGTPNKATVKRQKEVEASGLTPLDFLLNVMRRPDPEKESSMSWKDYYAMTAMLTVHRMDAAKAAAPYVHPKLSSVEVKGDADSPVTYRIKYEIVHTDRHGTTIGKP